METLISLGKSSRKLHSKDSSNYERDGKPLQRKYKLTMKLFDALISPILFYASEVWGIDCNGQLEKDPAELVQNKFLKWLLGVNKHCNNNACMAETGRFPMRIEAQCRNFKFSNLNQK